MDLLSRLPSSAAARRPAARAVSPVKHPGSLSSAATGGDDECPQAKRRRGRRGLDRKRRCESTGFHESEQSARVPVSTVRAAVLAGERFADGHPAPRRVADATVGAAKRAALLECLARQHPNRAGGSEECGPRRSTALPQTPRIAFGKRALQDTGVSARAVQLCDASSRLCANARRMTAVLARS